MLVIILPLSEILLCVIAASRKNSSVANTVVIVAPPKNVPSVVLSIHSVVNLIIVLIDSWVVYVWYAVCAKWFVGDCFILNFAYATILSMLISFGVVYVQQFICNMFGISS